jgi:hypothetical protein
MLVVAMKYLFPKIKLGTRLALYAGLGALGVATLVFGPRVLAVGSGPLGVALLIVGGLFVSAHHYRNKPLDLGFEDWRPASMAEFNRILTNLEKTRKAKLPLLYRRGCGVAVISAMLLVALFVTAAQLQMVSRFIVAAAALSFPLLLTGHVRLWTPAELKMRMDAFRAIVAATEKADPELKLVVTPYLRLDKDKEGRQIPEDVRLLVERRRKAEDFMGVQFQVAINKGPNGAVPYLYAVFLCKGKGKSFARFSALQADGFEVEPGADAEYGFVVLRQETSGGGYHTSGPDCAKLFDVVTKALA